MRVLITDDSATARDIIAMQLLGDPEIEVVGFAEDGRQAIELTRVLTPDLILMDVEMPGLNGVQTTQLIMQDQPTPIVILTANCFDGKTVSAANDAGALWILDKPNDDWNRTQREEFRNHLKFLAATPLPRYK